MRAVLFFVFKLGHKVYLTGDIKVWYNGVGIIIYKKNLCSFYRWAAYRDALAIIISLALGWVRFEDFVWKNCI